MGMGELLPRANAGIAHDFLQAFPFQNSPGVAPFVKGLSLNGPLNFSDPYANVPGGNPFPYTFSKNSVFPIQAPYVNVPMDYHPPYLNQWNLSVEKQIGANWLAKVSYLGSNTIHFWSPQALNPSVYIPGTCAAGQYGLAAPGPCSTTGNSQQRRFSSGTRILRRFQRRHGQPTWSNRRFTMRSRAVVVTFSLAAGCD